MKATLRYFMILALCLIPFTFIEIKERFPVVIGIFLAVTIAYWIGYALLEKKRKRQEQEN